MHIPYMSVRALYRASEGSLGYQAALKFVLREEQCDFSELDHKKGNSKGIINGAYCVFKD